LKFAPAITTDEVTAPVFGVTEVTLGTGVTVKVGPVVLTWPPTVTVTNPVVVPVGTIAVTLVAVQLVMLVADVPWNFTVLPATCDDRKLVPDITIDEVTAPEVGVRLVTAGTPVAVGSVI
jgi:hypothetical protein